jgi:hypothetical protein
MTWEVLILVATLTTVRLVWIIRNPARQEVRLLFPRALSNLWKIVRYDPNFSYVPYGIIWYMINVPMLRAVQYDGRRWAITLALIDTLFLWYSQILGLTVFLAYAVIGTFQLLRAPWNASINWLIILAPISWVFLLLAPIAKLPVGLPVQVWIYTKVAFAHQHNYIYWGLLATLWLIVFNHLYFLPGLDELVVLVFGASWSFVLARALTGKKHVQNNSSA